MRECDRLMMEAAAANRERLANWVEYVEPEPEEKTKRMEVIKKTPKTFEGKPCIRCGNTKRLLLNKSCVTCQAGYNKKRKEKLREIRESKPIVNPYLDCKQGRKCKYCGSVWRTSFNHCATCNKGRIKPKVLKYMESLKNGTETEGNTA